MRDSAVRDQSMTDSNQDNRCPKILQINCELKRGANTVLIVTEASYTVGSW